MKSPLVHHLLTVVVVVAALACLLALAPPARAEEPPAPAPPAEDPPAPDPAQDPAPPQAPSDWAPAVEAHGSAQDAPAAKQDDEQPPVPPAPVPPTISPSTLAPAPSPVPLPPSGIEDEAWLPGAPSTGPLPVPTTPPGVAPTPPPRVAPTTPRRVVGGPTPVRPSPPRWNPDRDVRIRILPDGRRVVVGPDGEPVDAEPASTMPTALDPLPAAPPAFPMPLPEDAPDDEWLPGAPQDDAWLPGAPPVAPPAADPAGLPPMPPPRPEEDAWLPGAPPVAPPAADPAGLPPMPPPRPEEDAWLPGPGTPIAPPSVAPTAPPPVAPAAPPPVAPAAPPPVAPAAPEAGEQPPPPPDGDMQFPTAPEADAAGHARKLLSAPGDPRVAGYPAHVVRPAEAAVALEPGHRPAVLLFYDDASRTSDQQAAEFLPVLVAYADRVDVVPIDVTDRDAWSPAEQKLVRTYYMAKVPTTVVLAADRRPVLLKFHRIAAAALESALEKAVGP